MSEQFDASRPIYAQLVERLKAGSWPAPTRRAGIWIRCVIWPQPPG